jgi:hypothetical protein
MQWLLKAVIFTDRAVNGYRGLSESFQIAAPSDGDPEIFTHIGAFYVRGPPSEYMLITKNVNMINSTNEIRADKEQESNTY